MPISEDIENRRDIVAVVGKGVTTGETLCSEGGSCWKDRLPEPVIRIAIEPKTKAARINSVVR